MAKVKNFRSEEMKIYDPLGICKEEVLASLREALKELGYEGMELTLEAPPENLGDIAFSCFSLAKQAKKAPQIIAEEIAEKIKLGENIIKCENVGAYVNFHVNPRKLAEMTLKAVLDLGEEYGNLLSRNRKIILEHTSANPTDKLHIGRARNPIIGDSLARILRKAGYDVETQYYVDDMGRQAVILCSGMEHLTYINRPENLPDTRRDHWDKIYKNIPEPEKQNLKKLSLELAGPYQFGSGATTQSIWIEKETDEWQNKLEKGDPWTTVKVKHVADETMEEKIKPILETLNVKVDNFVHESQFLSATKDLVEQLKGSEFCGEENGAYYLDLTEFGIDKKFFFVRADGTTLYATRDIAYHLWKAERAEDIINILGEDHKLEAKYVIETIKNILKKDINIETIFYSFVSLPEGRMSTRKGQVVFVDDLIEEALTRAVGEVEKRREDLSGQKAQEIAEKVAIGAIRYNIVRVQAEKKIVFRWEDALNFEGNSAPFIQYSHARASSILRKAKELGYELSDNYDFGLLEHVSEVTLIKEMAKFPETVKECAERRGPHLMAGYAYGLASMFNQFYRDCPVLASEDSTLRNSRLALVEGVRTVLRNSLFCLGVEAPEEM